MKNTALLVIDVQQALVDFGPYREQHLIEGITTLLQVARENGRPVIYVRHNEPGSELTPGSDDWQIYGPIAPLPSEPIIDKYYSSAFYKTDLQEQLDLLSIEALVIAGMQVEYCVDATVKGAFDRGYEVYLPKDLQSTFDSELFSAKDLIEHYAMGIWDKRFGDVISLDAAVALLQRE